MNRLCKTSLAGILLALACLALLPGGAAGGDVFKCTRSDGTIVFADSAAPLSADCQMEKVEELPPLGILPDTPSSAVATPPAISPATGGTGPSLDAFKSRAMQLVERFDDARRRSIRYSLVIQKQKALHELAAIRAEKSALLDEIGQAPLDDDEKRQLRELLARITD